MRGQPRSFGQLALAIAMASAACAGSADPGEEETAEHRGRYAATIRRTAFGIPHIEATTSRGLGYGLGYAYTEDNPCILAEAIVTARGQRSRYFGGDATFDPSGDGHLLVNLQADVYFRWLNDAPLVDASWAAQPAELKDLLRGYVRGVNRRLREIERGQLPEPCRDQLWVGEIDELDLIRLMRRTAVEASGLQMIDRIFAAEPPIGAASAVRRPAGSAEEALVQRMRPSKGSNGIALGHEATVEGNGLLLATPHFPWTGSFRFYATHLTIPGRLDVFGATLPGLPVVGIGHNRDVAWTHTVNSSRHFTIHQLALDPVDPLRYVVDGQSRPLRATPITVEVRTPSGGLDTVTHTLWSSEHGPLLILPGLFDWTAKTAFAFGDANADNGRMLAAWWQIDRARNVAQLREAVETTLGIPWVNTVAVDREGTAYFGDVTPVPNVPGDDACIPEPFRGLARRRLIVLDASASRCNWVTGRGGLPGLVPAAQLPQLVRRDFVQNSNDSAWMTHPAVPMIGFPPIVSIDGEELRPRTRQGLQQIEARLRGGAAPRTERFTMERLLDMAFSNHSFHATTLLDDLLALCARPGAEPNIARACGVLASWDRRAELTSVGYALFREWRRTLDESAAAAGVAYWRVPFDAVDPIHTPRGLAIADPAIAALARAALTEAVARLDRAGIDPTRPWGEQQVAVRGGLRIPVHGGGGEEFGTADDEFYNTIISRRAEDGHLEPFYGTSIVLAVSFAGGQPAARGLLAYSQSTDPSSPHFADQTQRFSRKDWIDFPFTREAIANDPALTIRVIRE
jgi:acyl-homoserine-lactone acylase